MSSSSDLLDADPKSLVNFIKTHSNKPSYPYYKEKLSVTYNVTKGLVKKLEKITKETNDPELFRSAVLELISNRKTFLKTVCQTEYMEAVDQFVSNKERPSPQINNQSLDKLYKKVSQQKKRGLSSDRQNSWLR